MTVYNITAKLDWAISAAWLAWQQEEAIPEAMATRLFEDFSIYRLTEPDDGEGPTFIIQFYSLTAENCQLYKEAFAPGHHQKALEKWGDQFVSFSTIMEAVN